MTKVTKQYFSAASKVYAGSTDSLADIIRKLAQDLARMRIDQIGDLTDSTGGTAVYPANIVNLTGSGLAAFTESGTASAPKAGIDTAIGKISNNMAVLARFLNTINAPLGLPLITDSTGGTVATAGTMPALDLTTTAVSSACVDVVSARLQFQAIKRNMVRLWGYVNRVAVAVGETKMTSALSGVTFDGLALEALGNTGSSVAGTSLSTIANASTNTELTAIGANLATMAKFLNDILGAQLTDLTDSTTGAASATAITVMTIPSVAVDGAATTSSPKAGFDTNLANAEDGIAELGLYVNNLLRRNNLSTTLLTDSTGVSTNGTLAAITQNLTAVDGSSGSSAVDFTTAARTYGHGSQRNRFADCQGKRAGSDLRSAGTR
jgi:hypothetical protein